MSYWQHEYLREAATMTRNATYRVDLPESGLLSGLVIELSADLVSGAVANGGNWRLIDFHGLVEVIGNGATVIKSYQAKSANYLAYLHQGVLVPGFWRNYASNTQFDYLVLLFGRYLKDPEFGLDLSRWDNVELRITNTATSTQYSNDVSADIKQIFLRDALAGGFRGYLRSETWREWTTVADETKYHTLPVEFPIASIILQALPGVDANNVENTGLINLMDDIDFRKKGGTLQIFKGGLDHLLIEEYIERGKYALSTAHWAGNADKGFNIGLGRVQGGGWGSGSRDGAGSATVPTLEGARNSFTQKAESSEADSPIDSMFLGFAPEAHVALWHEHLLRPDFLLDPSVDAPIDLNIHTRNAASAASGTNRIVLERLVTL